MNDIVKFIYVKKMKTGDLNNYNKDRSIKK